MKKIVLRVRNAYALTSILAALSWLACSVEPVPPSSLILAPGLEPLAPGDGGDAGAEICYDGGDPCAGLKPRQCCKFPVCHAIICGDDEECKDKQCFKKCDLDGGCFGLDAEDASSDGGEALNVLVCSSDNLCVPKGCASNLTCELGQVCDLAEGAGVCVPAIKGDSAPGCSASGAGKTSSILLGPISTLMLIGARTRRRRCLK
jgi:hypothetical protein